MDIIPRTEKIVWKESFISRYCALTDFEAFKKASLSYPRKSIRVNTLKVSVGELKKRLEKNWNLEQVPWCKEGFWITHAKKERFDIGNLIEHQLGYFYVQDASSMIPPLVLDARPGERVLDMCAAPGIKTTQIAMYMKNEGLLVANDAKADRVKPLGFNLQRCGVRNAVVTIGEGGHLVRMHDKTGYSFDRILVDAPCSGTGTINKSLKTIEMYNANMIKRLASIQKQLLSIALRIVKKGGTVVYSTCSNEPEEDEGVIDAMLTRFDDVQVEKVSLPGLRASNAVVAFEKHEYNKEVSKTLRIWPQDNGTEGFFIAKLRKK